MQVPVPEPGPERRALASAAPCGHGSAPPSTIATGAHPSGGRTHFAQVLGRTLPVSIGASTPPSPPGPPPGPAVEASPVRSSPQARRMIESAGNAAPIAHASRHTRRPPEKTTIGFSHTIVGSRAITLKGVVRRKAFLLACLALVGCA